MLKNKPLISLFLSLGILLSGCSTMQSPHVTEANNLSQTAYAPIVGNPNGDVTIVEYYDYECPHCHNQQSTIDEIIASNPDVRVVYRVYPILNPTSWYAAKASIAVAMQSEQKFIEFHESLMSLNYAPTPQIIDQTAKDVGVNMNEYKADLNSTAVLNQIIKNIKTAGGLNRPTPTILIGNYSTTKPIVYNEETTYNTLQKAVNEMKPSIEN